MSKSCGYTGAVFLLWASACTAQQFKIDGCKDDWAAIPAAINEVGMSGTAEDWEIDVKQVFFSAGPSNLYVFLSCLPSVKEAMGKNRDPRRICEMYFDVDNEFTTGSTRETNPKYGDIVGYERQMIVDTIIRNRTNVFANAYKAGEQIDLRVELRNPSNERWVAKEAPDPYVNHLPLFDVFIRGIGNDGRQYMNVMALVEPYLKTSVAVEGGEIRTWNIKASTQEKFLNGTPYGEEVPPGKYKLFVDGARMKSPEVEITINGP